MMPVLLTVEATPKVRSWGPLTAPARITRLPSRPAAERTLLPSRAAVVRVLVSMAREGPMRMATRATPAAVATAAVPALAL